MSPTNSVEREQELLAFWKEKKVFEESVTREAPEGNFVFYEGPPTANAAPGVHHVLARAFKDVIPRYKTMRGFRVQRKAGWDTHGLPVELQVEKNLGLKSKTEIESIVPGDPAASIAKFNAECKTTVWQFKEDWEKLTERIAFWLDLTRPYITYANGFIESVWNVIKTADDRKLLYQGHKVVPFCTRCGTALSSHEVAQGYREVTEDSVYIKCKVTKGNDVVQPGDFILTWTTTPWTLPGNVALAVGENIEYIKVIYKGEKFIVANGLEDKVFPFGDGEERTWYTDKKFKGKDLVGVEYEPLFPGAVTLNNLSVTLSLTKGDNINGDMVRQAHHDSGDSKAWTVVLADFVTTTDGTGVVHTAVMYGEDDYRLGEQVGLPKHHTVGLDGKFLPSVTELAGLYVKSKEATEKILDHLKVNGQLLSVKSYSHDYPFCWRCDTALLYYAKDSWFIKMTALQKDLLKNAKEITWVPPHIKEGRFGEWLDGIKDWAISRERYWGTPLPAWVCQSCKKFEIIGSAADLAKRAKHRNRFLFVRHGEAESNANNVMNLQLETSDRYPLTERGQRQIADLGKELKAEGVTKIYCSPFYRTKQTAELIGQSLGLPVTEQSAFVELIANPKFEGQPISEFDHLFEDLGYRFSSPDIEDPSATASRMLKAIAQLDAEHEGETIAIISHGDPIWFTLAAVQAYDLRDGEACKQVNYPAVGQWRELNVAPALVDKNGEYNFHRPYIDQVELDCKCGGVMQRVPEVLDVWFDSGSMPFSQYHYPFENEKVIDGGKISRQARNDKVAMVGKQYPADYICEAIDQTRGWFYTLLAVSTIMDKGTSYRNVICLGHINDAKGQKMSKSKGNTVDPWQVINQYGADALRWYLYTLNQPGDSKNFDPLGVGEVSRKPFQLLGNVLSFYKLYAAGEFANDANATNEEGESQSASSNILDRWVIAKLGQLIDLVTRELEQYHITESARAIGDFVNELSTWYVRRSRDRFKAGDQAAVETLGNVLADLAKLLAPFAPFAAEDLYQQLGFVESVHLAAWPAGNKKMIDEKLIGEMSLAQQIVERGLAARMEAGIKVRQPLASYTTAMAKELDQQLAAIITDELNVKVLQFGSEETLDTALTPELELEGLAREAIRQVNQLRKDAGLTITDKITILHEGLDELMATHGQQIQAATQATAIAVGTVEVIKAVGAGRVGIRKF